MLKRDLVPLRNLESKKPEGGEKKEQIWDSGKW